jgi:hypothetical protein
MPLGKIMKSFIFPDAILTPREVFDASALTSGSKPERIGDESARRAVSGFVHHQMLWRASPSCRTGRDAAAPVTRGRRTALTLAFRSGT